MTNNKTYNIYKLHPYNITGYFDGEGCFNISVYLNAKMKTGYSVTFSAEIKQHSNSVNLLYSIKEYFNGKGNISFTTNSLARYKISNIKDILNLILPHFDKYPLITSKHLNYLDFKKVILMIDSGDHLTEIGITNIIEIISKMNSKRSFLEKWNFCFNQSKIINNLNSEWVQAFTDSEGYFKFLVRNNHSNSCEFSISQNVHDYHVMLLFIKFFNGGKLYPLSVNSTFESAINYYNSRNNKNINSVIKFVVNTQKLTTDVIIPFFNKYPLYTTKSLDFEDWKTLIHLNDIRYFKTIEGKTKMLNLSKGMNKGRIIETIEDTSE